MRGQSSGGTWASAWKKWRLGGVAVICTHPAAASPGPGGRTLDGSPPTVDDILAGDSGRDRKKVVPTPIGSGSFRSHLAWRTPIMVGRRLWSNTISTPT